MKAEMTPNFRSLLLLCTLVLLAAVFPCAAQSVELRQRSGSAWRGTVGDMIVVTFEQNRVPVEFTGKLTKVVDAYIKVEAQVLGSVHEKVIFRSDIITVRTADAEAPAGSRTPKGRGARAAEPAADDAGADAQPARGVFLLPLEGFVGGPFRHEEIEQIGEQADKYGRGQIIVLLIESNGGRADEAERIVETIWELKKRHRVVAWINKAISAGCSTAMACDEIYFMTEGVAGSVTTIRGMTALSEQEAMPGVEHLAEVARRSGYSEHIGRAMKLKKYEVSYDKDPVTGEVTFYPDLSGEFILSTGDQNLSFNSSNAEHCGFSKGTADTREDLAKLLDLPRWHLVDDYGERIAEDWQRTVARAEAEIPLLLARFNYYKAAGGAQEQLGAQINLVRELIQWWDRCPNVAELNLPPKDFLERELEQLRKALADMRR